LAVYAVRRNPSARMIATRHLMFPLNRLHKITLTHVSRLIAVSNAVARDLRTQRLIAPEKIKVIQNGIDWKKIDEACERFNRAAFCKRWRLPADRPLVGSIGTLTPLKGHEVRWRFAPVCVVGWMVRSSQVPHGHNYRHG